MSVSTAAGSTSHLRWGVPPEMRDEIIDNLYADRAALRACSLTCHAWLPRARYHLFRRIVLEPGHNSETFACLMHLSPAIAAYIQDVELSLNAGNHSWWDGTSSRTTLAWPTLAQTPPKRGETDISETVAWLQRVLPPDTPPLIKVTALRLSGLPVSTAVTHALYPRFKNIKMLALDGCKALSFADFIELLHAFSRVKSLRLLAIQWLPRRHSPYEVDQQPFPKLKQLELSRKIDVAPLIEWMLSESMYDGIETLSCSVSSQKCASSIRNLLHALGPTLKDLQIDFQEARSPTDILQVSHFDLAQSTGLRHLYICCSASTSVLTHSSYLPSLSWIVLLLSTANSPQLQTVTFSISPADLRVLNVEGLDVVLSHPRYDGLKSVIFRIDPQRDSLDDETRRIRRRMPALDANGTLTFGK